MKERAALLGGKLFIEGTKNKGTHTQLILPLQNSNNPVLSNTMDFVH
jgi:nitrate/nitrite-specific signal transduction histidine kinase